MADRVALGKVGSTRGLRGEFRINPYSGEPEGIKLLERLGLPDGSYPKILSVSLHKRQAVVKVEGVDTLEKAQALAGQEVWVKLDDLPPTEDEAYYWFELVDCVAVYRDGGEIGTITSIETVLAHDNLVIALKDGGEARVPFVDAFVVEVDLEAKRVVLDPPPGLLDL